VAHIKLVVAPHDRLNALPHLPRTDKPLEKPLLIRAGPLFVAVGGGEVWISNSEGAVMSRVKR
jgi:hypothetical protein